MEKLAIKYKVKLKLDKPYYTTDQREEAKKEALEAVIERCNKHYRRFPKMIHLNREQYQRSIDRIKSGEINARVIKLYENPEPGSIVHYINYSAPLFCICTYMRVIKSEPLFITVKKKGNSISQHKISRASLFLEDIKDPLETVKKRWKGKVKLVK